MWASAHAQKMNIPVSMVTAADTFFFFLKRISMPDNRGSTVSHGPSLEAPKDNVLCHEYNYDWIMKSRCWRCRCRWGPKNTQLCCRGNSFLWNCRGEYNFWICMEHTRCCYTWHFSELVAIALWVCNNWLCFVGQIVVGMSARETCWANCCVHVITFHWLTRLVQSYTKAMQVNL